MGAYPTCRCCATLGSALDNRRAPDPKGRYTIDDIGAAFAQVVENDQLVAGLRQCNAGMESSKTSTAGHNNIDLPYYSGRCRSPI